MGDFLDHWVGEKPERGEMVAAEMAKLEREPMQLHYSETPLGSVLRQWETAEAMKALPESWLLPQAISAALYNHNVCPSTFSSGPRVPFPPLPELDR